MILFKLRKGDPSDSQADATASLTRDDDLPKLTHSSPTLYDSLRYDSTPFRVKPIAFGIYCTRGTGCVMSKERDTSKGGEEGKRSQGLT